MPYKIKSLAKKSMLEPGELVNRSEALLDLLNTHRGWVAIGVGLVLAVGLAWGGLTWFQIEQNRKAELLEYEASKEMPGTASPEEDRMTRYQRVSSLYQEVLTKYPRSSTAPFAQFQVANSYFELKQYDKAIAAYQDFIRHYPGNATLLSMVTLRLGYAHLFHGDPQAALADFDEVIRQKNAWNKDQAYYEMGRLYEGQGDKQSAIGRYESLIKEFPRSPWAGEAQTRLKALGVFQQPAQPSGENPPLTGMGSDKNEKK